MEPREAASADCSAAVAQADWRGTEGLPSPDPGSSLGLTQPPLSLP